MQGIKKLIIAAVLFTVFVWPANGNAQTNLYVSVRGKDVNPGTKSKPYASIDCALRMVRKIPGAVSIKLYGGTSYAGCRRS